VGEMLGVAVGLSVGEVLGAAVGLALGRADGMAAFAFMFFSNGEKSSVSYYSNKDSSRNEGKSLCAKAYRWEMHWVGWWAYPTDLTMAWRWASP